ncbi:uncharacterized protein TNCT_704941 [Trichonephila clavata]|uniref:Uncharacterized protein n=1 Tax=Trichonephila clavata TaxID=2740835 RepID=A0A8X6H9R0_TRICU|nr:uncharacterized protein TNCT_704941 [Trichonephila clavata]
MKLIQLLCKMKLLGGANVMEKVLQTLWLDKLQEGIKTILIVSKEKLDNLSTKANKIYKMKSSTEVYTIGADNSVLSTLLDKISNLEKQESGLKVHREFSK